MNERMSPAQRIVLIIAAVGFLHSSMVPPVMQAGGYVCRYHEFVGRQWPYMRGYDVANADMTALLSEYGIIIAAATILILALGFLRKPS